MLRSATIWGRFAPLCNDSGPLWGSQSDAVWGPPGLRAGALLAVRTLLVNGQTSSPKKLMAFMPRIEQSADSDTIAATRRVLLLLATIGMDMIELIFIGEPFAARRL